MSNELKRFLGDSPLRVLLKLVVFSIITGVIMSALDWSPRTIYQGIIEFFQGLWHLGFKAVYDWIEYFLLGAAIVVPVFALMRLFQL